MCCSHHALLGEPRPPVDGMVERVVVELAGRAVWAGLVLSRSTHGRLPPPARTHASNSLLRATSAEPSLWTGIRGRWSEGRWELQSREVGSILAALSQALGEEALRDVAVHPPTLEGVRGQKAG